MPHTDEAPQRTADSSPPPATPTTVDPATTRRAQARPLASTDPGTRPDSTDRTDAAIDPRRAAEPLQRVIDRAGPAAAPAPVPPRRRPMPAHHPMATAAGGRR